MLFELAGLEERSGRAGWAAEAELLYRRALAGSPAHVPCLAGLADLLSAGDGDGDGDGDAFEGTGNKSADFGGRGRLAEAVSLYIRALRASPSDAAIARNLGRAYEMGCLVQLGNGIELEAIGLQLEPFLWRPCGVAWDSSQTVD